ncbi:MAG: fused MFS/spermidine synthase [Clostridia bacterium]|nr:fused MFS/spermidine synthase [Clostridia bacterium]
MKKYRFEIILFVVNAAYMILELVASRVLAPFFGTSNLVWTSVIGIILLSSSIGNYIGGIIADKKNVSSKFKAILLFSFLTIIVIPFVQVKILTAISTIFSDIKVGAILATVLLFFIPSLLVGVLSPIILKLKLDSIDSAGKTSGKISAISTIGGIVGTFFGGFYLIPNFGSIHILFVLALSFIYLIPLVDFKLTFKSAGAIVLTTVVCLIIMNYNMDMNEITGVQVKNDIIDSGSVSYDTQYGRVLIYNAMRGEDEVRVLNIDSGFESATFINKEKRNELVFEYTKYYDLMFKANIDIKDTLMIGGAGYNYPKYFISHYQDKTMDVVEIDGEITEIAKEYFYLNDLIREYKIEENKRLGLITDDGRVYLNQNTKKYDAILNDAFAGNSPAKTLTTKEAAEKIKASLNTNGVYLTNIISALEGEESKFIKAEVNTLKQVFKNVYIVPCYDVDPNEPQNTMVIASDDDIVLDKTYKYEIEENEIILTDDYCPVDTLIPKE